MVVLIIFPVILQTVINVSIRGHKIIQDLNPMRRIMLPPGESKLITSHSCYTNLIK